MMNKTKNTLILTVAMWLSALVVALAGSSPALAEVKSDPVAVYGARADYDVYRGGDKVGSHSLRFSQQGDTLSVKVESALTVRVLKIPVFRFRYESTETWVGGELQRVVSNINENGKQSTVSLRTQDAHSLLKNAGGSQKVKRLRYTSNHWLEDAVKSSRLFNTLNGKASNVAVEALGRESFRTAKGKTEARRFRYSGGVKADVWYDDAGRWVGLQFKADDDSNIVYRARF